MRTIFDTTDEHGDDLPSPDSEALGFRPIPALYDANGEVVIPFSYYLGEDDPADSLPVIRGTVIA